MSILQTARTWLCLRRQTLLEAPSAEAAAGRRPPYGSSSGFIRTRGTTFFLLLIPTLAFAQSSPFQTGATALQSNLLTLLTPVAIILVIGLGVMAMANRIAWGWCIGAIAGIAVAFGAPQIVGWIRGMFGV